MFKINQKVVHKSHGVGKIVAQEKRQFGENVSEFYILEILDSGTPKKVFVDVNQASERLRGVADVFTLNKAKRIATTPSVEVFEHSTWNRRYREFMEKIHTGDVVEIAQVLAALVTLAEQKDLSFGERKLLECAYNLVNAELEAAGIDTI